MAKVFVANGKKNRAKKAKARVAAKRRHNPLPLLVGNPTRRRVSIMAKSRKKKNPSYGHAKASSKALGRPRHHRKNPFIGDSAGNNVRMILGASGGLLADVYVPAWILGMLGMADTGLTSYALAALTVLVPAWALHKFNFAQIAKGWLAGGGAAFVWRVVDDLTGQKYVTVQSGMGSYLTNQQVVFPGPNLFGQYARKQLPAASAASPVAVSSPVSKGVGYLKYPYAA
jgi:hypothetical protein